ncbi:MAG: DNA polymerase III subunit gamma and tau [Micromonosporaceae bacterium]
MADDLSSLALYRKYRPATFAEVKGQDHVTVPLRQALLAGRVHHAYLFSGPRGCGKTSSARILARSLNCEQGPTPDPCGKCESCVALAPGGPGSIDVIEIDAASHGGVDDARDLRERAFYAPVSGRFKVYIIDEAHMVTREGFNALLKLVEEPPPHLKFVFATTEPEKVIGTIRSRTHHYPFRLVAPQVLRALLEEILDAEGVTYEPEVLPLVVRAGAGSARDALSVLDQLLAGSDSSGISYAAAVSLLGYTDSSLLDETVDALAAGDGAAVFGMVQQVINAGHDPRRFAADLLDRLRDLIVLGAVGDADRTGLLDVPGDQLDRMRNQVENFGTARLTRAAEVLNAGLTEMRGAASPRLLLELTCARMLLPGAEADQSALLARLEQIERRFAVAGASHGVAAEAPAPAPPPAPEPQEPPGRPGRPAAAADTPKQSTPKQSTPKQGAAKQGAAEQGGSGQSAPKQGAAEQGGSGQSAAEPGRTEPRAAEPGHIESGRREPPPAEPGMLDTEALRRDWDGILDAVRQVRKVSWIQLSNAAVASLDGNVLTIEFARDGDLKGFTASRSDALLAKVLHERFGVEWRIQGVAAAGRERSGPSGLVAGGQDQVTAKVATPQRSRGGDHGSGATPPRHSPDDPQSPAAGQGQPGQRPRQAQQAEQEAQAQWPRKPQGARGRRAQDPTGPGTRTGPPDTGPPDTGPPDTGPLSTGIPAEADEIDPDNDADAGAELTGMELIRRELGGEVIDEIDHSASPGK